MKNQTVNGWLELKLVSMIHVLLHLLALDVCLRAEDLL